MGLAAKLMSCVKGEHAIVQDMQRIATRMEQDQDAWIAELRAAGVKAAHPDDGWVSRTRNTVYLCYPQFNDGLAVGDLLALGWPQWGSKKLRHRLVRVTGKLVGPLIDSWVFEEVA